MFPPQDRSAPPRYKKSKDPLAWKSVTEQKQMAGTMCERHWDPLLAGTIGLELMFQDEKQVN